MTVETSSTFFDISTQTGKFLLKILYRIYPLTILIDRSEKFSEEKDDASCLKAKKG